MVFNLRSVIRSISFGAVALGAILLIPTSGMSHDVSHLVDDPARDGWSTEVFHDRASEQLGELSDMLADTSQVTVAGVRRVVADDFSAQDLRPTQRKQVFADRVLSVFRWSADDSLSAPLDRMTATDLKDAIKRLGFLAEANARAKFKIYRVTLTENGFETLQFLSMSGQSEKASREVHAVWRCRWMHENPQDRPKIRTISVEDYEETLTKNLGTMFPPTMFRDCTSSLLGRNSDSTKQFGFGIDYWSNRLLRVGTEGMQGLAIGDVNADGLDDFYVCQIGPLPNRLFVQEPDGTATDRSSEYGVDWLEPSHSALFVDWDNDGDQDLLISTITTLLVMENDGVGRFTLRSTVTAARNAYSLSAADYDQDGDLDVFACLYAAKASQREVLAVPVPFHDATNGGRNVLLRNDGAWRVRDVTQEAGLDEESTRRSFAASWEDFDNDGDLDLYVANDYGKNNLFRNDHGRFRNIASAAKVEDQSFGMSVSWGDYDRDGWMDLYVSNMFSAAGNRIVFQKQFRPHDDQRHKFQYMARGNSLFRNAKDGGFHDVSHDARIMMGYWSWGSKFADLNNDGYEDLIVMNGFLTRRETKDL